jgi:hypothetical protein
MALLTTGPNLTPTPPPLRRQRPKPPKLRRPKKPRLKPVATVFMPDGTQHAVTPSDGKNFTSTELQAMIKGTRDDDDLPTFQVLGNEPGFRPTIIAENRGLDKYACLVDEDGRHFYGNVKNGQISYMNEEFSDFDPVGPVAVMLKKFFK